jgi:hypothetical protein
LTWTGEAVAPDCGDVADWDSAADAAATGMASANTIAKGFMIALQT